MFKKIAFICCLALAFGCSKTPVKCTKPLLLVSISPYRFLTERIAGEEFEVQTVVSGTANPHSYEPTAGQVSKMCQSLVWFRIGEPFEEKILPILKQRNAGLVAFDLREGLELIEASKALECKHCSMDHLDRHIWLSPKLMGQQAEMITRSLSEKFPEKKEVFGANLRALQSELRDLDAEIHALLRPITNRTLLVSHPAFGYFCKEYNFEQLSIEYEGKDPRPKHLEQILKLALSQSIDLALALPQHNNKGAQLVAEKLHVPVCLIDPYSSDYFETMRKLAHLIADAN